MNKIIASKSIFSEIFQLLSNTKTNIKTLFINTKYALPDMSQTKNTIKHWRDVRLSANAKYDTLVVAVPLLLSISIGTPAYLLYAFMFLVPHFLPSVFVYDSEILRSYNSRIKNREIINVPYMSKSYMESVKMAKFVGVFAPLILPKSRTMHLLARLVHDDYLIERFGVGSLSLSELIVALMERSIKLPKITAKNGVFDVECEEKAFMHMQSLMNAHLRVTKKITHPTELNKLYSYYSNNK